MSQQEPLRGGRHWEWLALAVGFLTLVGSLWLTFQMELRPCPLCYYERAIIASLCIMLGMGLQSGRFAPPGYLAVVGLGIAFCGLVILGRHVHMELNGEIECPAGIFGLGSAPQQAMFCFLLLNGLLILAILRSPGEFRGLWSVTRSILLGAVMAVVLVKSVTAPPSPAGGPLDGCRKIPQAAPAP